MSIRIPYRGTISNTDDVDALTDEVEDIAKSCLGPARWDDNWKVPPDTHFESIRGVVLPR